MASSCKSVLVIGSVNADVVVEVDRLPLRGETISASKPDTGRLVPGGKGANQAAAAARLLAGSQTCKVRFAGQFGNDGQGQTLERSLQAVGADTELCGHPECPSGQAFVFVYPDGDNSIVIVGGANRAWPAELPEALVQAIESSAIVLVQNEIPPEMNDLVALTAARAGIPVMWDTGGDDRAMNKDILNKITYLCPNETELARLANKVVTSTEQAVEVARHMQSLGAKNVLVTLGSYGSVFVPETGDVIHQRCFKVDNVIDTTGAGDCYRGAFAVALAEGKSIQDSMQFAAAASALCVQVSGAQPSMPSAESVAEFLRQHTS